MNSKKVKWRVDEQDSDGETEDVFYNTQSMLDAVYFIKIKIL